MSKIETSFLGNDVMDVDLKEKEIKKFETIFPSAKVIRDKYETETQLENDWRKYLELPYSIKLLANDKCLRYFGKRNPQMYYEMKKKFLKKDIENKEIDNTYKPDNLIEENSAFVNKLARTFMNETGAKLVTRDSTDYDDLKKQWYTYNEQDASKKEIANSKSMEYYDANVFDVYKNELKKYLLQDLNKPEPEDDIESVSNIAIENVQEYLQDNNNLIESAILIDIAKNDISTPVERTIYNTMVEQFDRKMNIKGLTSPVLLDSSIGMTDDEVLNSLNEDGKARILEDTDFISFQARLCGLCTPEFKPNREDFIGESAFNKLKHGWNPTIRFNSRNCRNANRRMNFILKENSKFRFIPLHNINMTLQEDFEPKRGISILTIRDLEPNSTFDKNNAKVFLTFNPKDPSWFEYRNGSFLVKSNVQDTINNTKSGMVNLYFVELSDSLYNKAKDLLNDFNRSDNKLKNIITKLHISVPNVGNSNLFTVNLLTSIFANKYGSGNDKTAVYILYSGLNPSSYQDIEDSYQRLNIFTEYKNITESTFLEDTFKPNVLNEITVANKDLFKDNEEFIHRESVDFNSEYQHIHAILKSCQESQDIEAMKYYAAKLFYMNNLIENKLYFQENSPVVNLPLIYQTRGNILQEANKTVANILTVEPNFDMKKYYSNTLFETNNQSKKLNLTEAFRSFKELINAKFNLLKS